MSNLIKVARLQFLIAGLVLFLLGALMAAILGAPLPVGRLLPAYLVIAAAQLSVHFGNDYFDVATDEPGSSTLISGGGGVLLLHPELREPVKRIALALLSFSIIGGVLFVVLYSYPLWTLALVLLGNALGWFYSAPPLRLSQRGWGEICFALVAGFLVPGVGYLTARGTLDLAGAFWLMPLLLYGLVSILSVEIPDWETDHAGGKRTWIERRGRRFGFIANGLLLAAATSYFFLLPRLLHEPPFDVTILGWFSLLPLAVGLVGLVIRPAGREAATRIAVANVIALVVFGLLADAYLLTLIGR